MGTDKVVFERVELPEAIAWTCPTGNDVTGSNRRRPCPEPEVTEVCSVHAQPVHFELLQ